MKGHVQLSGSYEGKRTRDLRTVQNAIYGNLPAYSQWDAATGLKSGPWTAELYVRNLFDRRGIESKAIQCPETTCGDPDGLTDNRRQDLLDGDPPAHDRAKVRPHVLRRADANPDAASRLMARGGFLCQAKQA